jgi:hypothetical protein
MLRTLLMGMALLSAPALVAPPAFAATPEELDRLKSEADVAADKAKAMTKLADDFDKNVEKEKDNTETKKAIREYLLEELANLRKLGIPTNPEEPEEDVAEPEEEIPADEREKLVALRDLCVKMKTHKLGEKDKPFAKDLRTYIVTLDERAERKQTRYDKEKEASK